MKRKAIAAFSLAALVFGGATFAQNGPTTLVDGHGAAPPASAPQLAAVLVDEFPGTGTNAGPTLTHLRSPPCTTAPCDTRVFVQSKQGIIYIIKDGQRLAEPFIDYSADVNASRNTINGEQGTHSFAFHPNFAQNGKFYVFFLRPAQPSGMNADPTPVPNALARIVREYTVSADNPDRADLASARDILVIPATGGNIHNGGAMIFGPDGYLYIGIGDGGQGGVAARGPGAQNPESLYGKLLRIDVNTTSEGRQYGIPAGNLYAAGEGLPEIVALGLRNPFGFSIDGDWLFWGETGENSWEEVGAYNLRNGVGSNFGWSIAEGVGCFSNTNDAPRSQTNELCDRTGLTPPVFEYHSQARPNPCSAIGGVTYRGSAIPELQGQYFFGDYCVGLIRSFELVDGVARNVTNWTDMIAPGYRFGLGGITGFGVDSQGEMYILTTTYVFGTAANLPNPAIARVWKIVPAELAPAPAATPRQEWVATTQNPIPPVLQPPPLQREAPPADLGLPLFSTFSITQIQLRADPNVPDPVAGVLPAGTNVVLTLTINGHTRTYTLPIPATSDFSSDRVNALLQTFASTINGQDFWGVPVTASYAVSASGAAGNGTLTIGTAVPATFDRFTILVTGGPESGTTSGNFFSSLTATPAP